MGSTAEPPPSRAARGPESGQHAAGVDTGRLTPAGWCTDGDVNVAMATSRFTTSLL
jgi:hypothetical protein